MDRAVDERGRRAAAEKLIEEEFGDLCAVLWIRELLLLGDGVNPAMTRRPE